MNRALGAVTGCTLVLALTAGAIQVMVVRDLPRGPEVALVPWAVALSLAFLAVELVVVRLRLGPNAYAFSLMELPLVIGLFFMRPDLLVACRLVGAVAAFTLQRKPLRKSLFNCAMFGLETVCAVTVWHLVLGTADPLGPRGWLATAAAALVTSLIGSSLVSLVIWLSSGERPRSLGEVLSLGPAGDLASACFALISVYIISVDWRACWLLVIIAATLFAAHRGYDGSRRRSEALEQVNRFTEVVGRSVGAEAVARDVVTEIQSAFGVARVELRLDLGDREVRERTLGPDGQELPGARLIAALEDELDDGVLLAPRHDRSDRVGRILETEGVLECLVVPLRSEGRSLGLLAVADRLGDLQTFAAEDLRQLRALANHAALALDNTRRADELIEQAEARERAAMHDDLTGLPNRRLFARRLAEVLTLNDAALLLLDLDGFKKVNDTLGHEIGDALLCQVADRLRTAVGGSMVARFGGDVFAVLLPGAGDEEARACAYVVRDALTRHFDLGGVPVAVDASVGLACGARDDDPAALLRRVDVAMYAAKDGRGGLEVWRPEMDRRDTSKLGLLADLRQAIATGALDVHYQPKYDVLTGRAVGAEALVRWTHATLGPIGPDEFVAIAEQSSLITPLTMLVLSAALRECVHWRSTEPDAVVAVNISPRSLLDPAFVDDIARELAAAGLPASALTLEITEGSLMRDPEGATAALQRLRGAGVKLSVDDLGTGYSSLAYLQRLPVHEIKIDRSFLADFTDPAAQAVVGAIIDLSHRLGHTVVAEGVEDGEAFRVLHDLGCDIAQGFWLSRPLTPQRMSRLLWEQAVARTAAETAAPLRLIN